MKTALGGDRIGAGGKMDLHLRNYERSNHNLSYKWRTSMGCGTIVPFMTQIGLPGDSFDINLNATALTLPTIGPLFGRYKMEAHVFGTPMRLYQGDLVTNKLKIGMNMANVKFPLIKLTADGAIQYKADGTPNDRSQINSSCILAYLGIQGVGRSTTGEDEISRTFAAGQWLAYWDIYKNYFANKQEEIGYYIHGLTEEEINLTGAMMGNSVADTNIYNTAVPMDLDATTTCNFTIGEWHDGLADPIPSDWTIYFTSTGNLMLHLIFDTILWNAPTKSFIMHDLKSGLWGAQTVNATPQSATVAGNPENPTILLSQFNLSNIDTCRREMVINNAGGVGYIVNEGDMGAPYDTINTKIGDIFVKSMSQEGLGIKTYNSDLFNNWVSTEWIDGVGGINEITAVDTSSGSFTIDALTIQRKVYDVLNRIGVSGGSYQDWINATYDHNSQFMPNDPIYYGGLMKEIAFEEVISNAAAEDLQGVQPLGTLGGRGVMTNKHKGGKIHIKCSEPMYITGVVSITPIIDYSQGNDWQNNVFNYDELHKPGLDQIGFQELLTDQMHWADTTIDPLTGVITYQSAGKQVAWQNYMTDINKVRGTFAVGESQDYMVLNRRYDIDVTGITDVTTYIDPTKFNHIFADGRIDAQNFWVHMGIDMFARRKMSARQIPNL